MKVLSIALTVFLLILAHKLPVLLRQAQMLPPVPAKSFVIRLSLAPPDQHTTPDHLN